MSKHILKLNVITHLAYGMEESNNIEIKIDNNIENFKINQIIETTDINNINNNINTINIINEDKNSIDDVNRILGKENINYEEYKILLDAFGNKDLDNSLKEKILEKIEKDNIVRLKDIEDIIEIKDKKDILEDNIEKDVNYINEVFKNKFLYKFSDNIDLYNIYLVIHTIRLILERNQSIKDLIKESFDKIVYNFILSDYKDNTSYCGKINEVLEKYKIDDLKFSYITDLLTGKIKDGQYDAFVSVKDKYFTIFYENKYLNGSSFYEKPFLKNAKKEYTILDELININKNIDEEILKKTIHIMFITLHEFNHFLLALIKSLKNKKIEQYLIHQGPDKKLIKQINEEINKVFIENFKNHEIFKDYYEEVKIYLNKELGLKYICGDIDENLIKNYTNYSFIGCNKNGNILDDKDQNLIDDFINLKKISKAKNFIDKYNFFKYLHDKEFFFGREYNLKYFALKEENKNIYNSFLAHFNNFYSQNNNLNKNKYENENLAKFYKFLLSNKYNFDENTFNSLVEEYVRDNGYAIYGEIVENKKLETINYLKKNYSFFKYLYDKKFFFGRDYDLEYYDFFKQKGVYNSFLAHFNNFYSQNNILNENENKNENDEMISFYKFLLYIEYNFDENTFGLKINDYIKAMKIRKNIENLEKKDYSKLDDIIIKVNTLECLADDFSFSNFPLIMEKGMRALGYWQRNLFKHFAELYKTKGEIKEENKIIIIEEDKTKEKNDKNCIIF